MRHIDCSRRADARILVLSLSAAILTACGGSGTGTSSSAAAPAAAQSYSLTLAAPSAADGLAQPAFHLAPVILDQPDDMDRIEASSSATAAPRQVALDPTLAQLSTLRLTGHIMHQLLETGTAPESAYADGSSAHPFASSSSVTVYTPAQIRAAYNLPALPGATASITSAQAAQLGAGQTIYLIDAHDDPHAAAELAAFDAQFGLPTCAVTSITAAATLPLAAAPTTGCTLSVVYSTPSGAMTATAPAYDSGWALEIALDVQWAHATAPYARIILIEAPDASVNSLSAAVQLANQMGPGAVSQSFGATEGSWTGSVDATFTAPNMTYLAAAGDSGAAVEWPAVSPHVLAVAGTSLAYSAGTPRSETVWSGTGGGVSAYVPVPAYQTLAVPGLSTPAHRAVSDVTFNANPSTGQYLAIIPPGATSPNWYSVGGTSLATPQWAGVIAIANALRSQTGAAPVGAVQPSLYTLATQPTRYASAFLDITQGSDGSCATCYAGVGYDLPSGLGSPNVTALLSALNPQAPSQAPVVTGASVSGKVGTALSFSISATAAHPLTYSLTAAPAGMTVNATSGVVTWNTPVAGSYAVVAHALDAQTGLAGQATITVTIAAPQPPQVAGGSIAGTAQVALVFPVQVTDTNAVTYSLAGAPSGMSVSPAGLVSWPVPLIGTYAVTVAAHDATTGLSGQGQYSVTITAPKPPVVAPASIAGTVGKALSFTVNATDANPLTFTMAGAPTGMTLAGSTGVVTWSNPVAGTFAVTVTAHDAKTGLSGQGVYTVTISKAGPVITATSWTGVAGKALTGSMAFSDSSASVLSITIGGVPAGMTFSVSGNVITARWPSPATGSYALQVTAIDANKLSGSASIPITITAH